MTWSPASASTLEDNDVEPHELRTRLILGCRVQQPSQKHSLCPALFRNGSAAMYGSPSKYICVTSRSCRPETWKWMCAGRMRFGPAGVPSLPDGVRTAGAPRADGKRRVCSSPLLEVLEALVEVADAVGLDDRVLAPRVALAMRLGQPAPVVVVRALDALLDVLHRAGEVVRAAGEE